jgi:Xaa-Pro aminopeptidase
MDGIYKKRNSILLKILKQKNLDAILFFSKENIRYLCGFTGSSGVLLCRPHSRIFFTDSRYIEQAENEVIGAKVRPANLGTFEVYNYLDANGIRNVGIESAGLTYQEFLILKKMLRRAKIKPLFDELQELRAVKAPQELKSIKNAVRIAESALREVMKLIKTGITESEIAIELEHCMKLNGSDELPFNVIVLSGKNTSLPHGRPGKRRLKKGDLILIDFGARSGGYCSDETVTFVFGGVNREQSMVYNAVNDARKYAIESIREGVKASEIDSVARGYLDKKGLAKYFGHGLGHGVGLAIHESPRLSNNSKTVLKSGMVLTVEPGVYIPGWGGVRLEDMVEVNEKGAKILTGVSKELRIIKG